MTLNKIDSNESNYVKEMYGFDMLKRKREWMLSDGQ